MPFQRSRSTGRPGAGSRSRSTVGTSRRCARAKSRQPPDCEAARRRPSHTTAQAWRHVYWRRARRWPGPSSRRPAPDPGCRPSRHWRVGATRGSWPRRQVLGLGGARVSQGQHLHRGIVGGPDRLAANLHSKLLQNGFVLVVERRRQSCPRPTYTPPRILPCLSNRRRLSTRVISNEARREAARAVDESEDCDALGVDRVNQAVSS